MRIRPEGEKAVSNSSPIGVFDSGVGGLTVLRALLDRLPGEDFVYLGDTARLPYGTKSPGSIRQYSLQAARLLRERGVKCLVVACNTASAIALDALTHEFDPVPVIGVLEPGAAAACRATRAGRIAVLATESTVRGGAYQAAIARRRPDAIVTARACPMFVALAEEGWTDGPIVEGVIHRYLDEVFVAGAAAAHPDTLVLGCTHYPLLAGTMRAVFQTSVTLIDSGEAAAAEVESELRSRGLINASTVKPRLQFLVSDISDKFAEVGERFLGRTLGRVSRVSF